MEELVSKIQKMDDYELQQVMDAIEKRYAEAYPQWDVIYMALPKDPKLRKQEAEALSQFLRKYNDLPIP